MIDAMETKDEEEEGWHKYSHNDHKHSRRYSIPQLEQTEQKIKLRRDLSYGCFHVSIDGDILQHTDESTNIVPKTKTFAHRSVTKAFL